MCVVRLRLRLRVRVFDCRVYVLVVCLVSSLVFDCVVIVALLL